MDCEESPLRPKGFEESPTEEEEAPPYLTIIFLFCFGVFFKMVLIKLQINLCHEMKRNDANPQLTSVDLYPVGKRRGILLLFMS